MYANTPAQEPAVLAHAADWSAQTGGALLNTEFGATTDPPTIDRMVGELDHALLPWIWWSYDALVPDMTKPPTGANLASAAVAELIRPHAVAVAGTPTASSYNPRSHVLQFSWSTTGPSRRRYPAGTTTVFKVPASVYAKGYSVRVTGGRVTSRANAAQLTITNNSAAPTVTVQLRPA